MFALTYVRRFLRYFYLLGGTRRHVRGPQNVPACLPVATMQKKIADCHDGSTLLDSTYHE